MNSSIVLYDSAGNPVFIDLAGIEQNQCEIIQQNETLIEYAEILKQYTETDLQQSEEIIKDLDSQIVIDREINQFCGFCFVMLIVFFLYRIFHSVMSF